MHELIWTESLSLFTVKRAHRRIFRKIFSDHIFSIERIRHSISLLAKSPRKIWTTHCCAYLVSRISDSVRFPHLISEERCEFHNYNSDSSYCKSQCVKLYHISDLWVTLQKRLAFHPCCRSVRIFTYIGNLNMPVYPTLHSSRTFS